MIYVAAPFWHEVEAVRAERRALAQRYAMQLFRKGVHFYNPLAHSAGIKEAAKTENYWIAHGRKMVRACTELHILCVDGWRQSSGIRGGIEEAEAAGIPVRYITQVTRLSFHGSRSLTFAACEPVIMDALLRYQPSALVTHGEATGACEWVRKIAQREALPLTLHHLDKAGRGPGAFHWRSVAVLDDSDCAVFLWDGASRGCSNEIALALKMQRRSEVWLFKRGVPPRIVDSSMIDVGGAAEAEKQAGADDRRVACRVGSWLDAE